MRPTEVLTQEHRTIEVLFDRLVQTAFAAARGDAPDVALAKRLVHALSALLGCWHRQKEEELFFPLIQERGLTQAVMRAALVEEAHESLGEDIKALANIVERAEQDPSLWHAVGCRALDLAGHARSHMRNEEEIVFPLAEASIRESDRAALISAFARIELLNPIPGAREDIEALVGQEVGGRGAMPEHVTGMVWAGTGAGRAPALVRSCA